MTVSIEVDDKDVLAALDRLAKKGANLRPALQDIGEYLAETTKRRFDTSTGPDGQKWAPNSEATMLNYLRLHKGNFTRKGKKLSAKGIQRVQGKRPLIGETRSLSSTINYQIDGNELAVGTPMVYGAMQQYGGKKSDFPNLWGDIPARPFLGLSDTDRTTVLDILQGYLSEK